MKLNLEKIDRELARLGWSKYRLAKEMGVIPSSIYAVLDPDRSNGMTFKTVDKIGAALGIDPKDLIE